MKLMVSGGRAYNAPEHVDMVDYWLRNFHRRYGFKVLIEGSAVGIDTLCKKWALSNGLIAESYPVSSKDWKEFPGIAAFMRNQRMIDEGKPDIALIFPGGNGTEDTLCRCIAAKILTFHISLEGTYERVDNKYSLPQKHKGKWGLKKWMLIRKN